MMQLVEGVWFPEGESHLTKMIRSSRIIDGRGTYQYQKLEAALKYVKHRRIAVDVGMHVGLWAMHLVKEFKSVIGFEPSAEHIECLKKNMVKVKNYKVHDYALGNRRREVGLKLFIGSTGSTQIDESGAGVLMMRLDDLKLDCVDFIKIDVENYEPFVVEGGEETIRRHKPVIVIEQKGVADNVNRKEAGRKLDYGRSQYAAKELLESWGAKVKFEMHGDFCLCWR